ncbi:pilus assembly protein PilC [Caldimicrobium thiodismutans]|uniref:Pilus assembly protein PilC n=1 Tax=Caldimicrobium thiodismutans TaxID=1653476 RepID=A0A0U5AZF1_9BACT|nr:type II secretion system F family protein [Caldimicrobium thiodismutans]BAU24078.1 pilus assembly protein PilC [Caldimicrobium thiodismutans]
MPLFTYTALTREGTLTKGEGEYQSPEELYYALQREGLTLVNYSVKRTIFPKFFSGRVKRKELAEFLHHLAFLLRSGVPLITSLEDLEKETKNPKLKREINKIRIAITRGETFRSAVEKTKLFPPVVISLIQIGEESGTLDRTLEEASKHLYRVDEIISQTKRALIYPAFVLFAMSGALAFWIFFVLPKLLGTFKEMGVKLPLPTIILMKVVNFFLAIKFYLPLFLIISIITILFLYRHPKTQIPFERLLLKIPIFGRVRRLNFLAFFFEHFALLLSAGIDLLRLLKLMYESFHRLYHKKIVKNIEESILAGENIASALKKEKIFRPLDIRMISVGEATGRLEEQMKMLANFYYQEVQNIVDTLTKILEPVVLAIAGIIFLIIIIALVGPIYELISQIGKTS